MDNKFVYKWAMATNAIFAVMLFLPTFTSQDYYSIYFYMVLLLGIASNGVLIINSYKSKCKYKDL